MPAAILLTIIVSYLIGAIPFGYLIARARGVDILRQGSGNIGATNVGRVLGKKFGILVFIFDFLKGALPSFAGESLRQYSPSLLGPDGLAVLAGLAAFLGHLFPVYLRFRGGKGVATGAGVVAVLLPGPALVALLVWVIKVAMFRYISLASIGAALTLVFVRLLSVPEPFSPANATLSAFCLLAAGLVIARHHANIGRLLRGTEPQLPDSSTMLTATKVIHVFAVGLWFGSVVFFTFVVGLSIFSTMDRLTVAREEDRPAWLPVPAGLKKERLSEKFPEPLVREQGSRIAGAAVGPMFTWYFAIQAVCAAVAVGTALGWARTYSCKIHRCRSIVLCVALIGVMTGWWLEGEVDKLRAVRSQTSDLVLFSATSPSAEQIQAADAARSAFGTWHAYSIFANFVTLGFLTVAMGMCARLPEKSEGGPALPAEDDGVTSR